MALHLLKRDDGEYERVVMCELLIPDIPNSYGDIYTKQAVKDFCYEYARQGYGLDVEHDNVDMKGEGLVVVESFIARPGDPTFIEGSWVVGMKVLDDATWEKVLSGELNGFSYEAECFISPVLIQNLRNRQVAGTTEPDPVDGHTHTYLVLLDALNRPISGATGVSGGHFHKIVFHTTTEEASSGRSHHHRYQVIVQEDEGETDAGT